MYSMYEKSHVVVRLPVHLPRQQIILDAAGEEREAYARAMGRRSKLEAYFCFNALLRARIAAGLPLDWHPTAMQPVAYEKMPSHYTWNPKVNEWVLRANKSGNNVIGRLTSASPREQERYYLRVLLKHIHDATCYADLSLKRGPDLRPSPLPQNVEHHNTSGR